MGRMLNAFKQIDQKRGKADAAPPQMTQPMPTADEIAEAEAHEAAPLAPIDPPSSVLTGEEIAALGGSGSDHRTVDELEQDMRELEYLLSLEEDKELPLRLDADPLGLRTAPSHPTEAYKPPAGDGAAHDPVERADDVESADAWPPVDMPSDEAFSNLTDSETDLMHAALREQARGSDADASNNASPFVMFAGEQEASVAPTPPAPAPALSTPKSSKQAGAATPPLESPATPSVVHWPFMETPLQREDHDRLARQVVDQLPRSLPASLMLVGAGRHGTRLPAVLGLARALAERDEGRILLIDADATQREITRRLAMSRTPGLFDLLGSGKTQQLATTPTDFEGLDFLPLGGRKTRVTSEALRTLLAELKRKYRFVILETGGASAPLGDLCAQVTDAVYMLVELGMTTREDARKTARRLRQGGACLRGVVLAGLSPSEASVFRPTALLAHS
jgi:Mrp family chromosome partitioning ATPase